MDPGLRRNDDQKQSLATRLGAVRVVRPTVLRLCVTRSNPERRVHPDRIHFPSTYNCHRSLVVICRKGRMVMRPAMPMLCSR